jgi:hypothetical protein
MHKEILNTNQNEVFNIVKHFSDKGFYLAGGTALALQLGHRESLDFDMFKYEGFNNEDILKDLMSLGYSDIKVVFDKLDEYTIYINSVKFTFLRYPFEIKEIKNIQSISIASPLDLGAMKAYALGRRSKWKDYVDLYILFHQYDLESIVDRAEGIYSTVFSERMFLQQLCYFKDIDYTEQVIWRIDNPPSNEKIQQYLKKIATI